MSLKPGERGDEQIRGEFDRLRGPRTGRELPLLAAVDLSLVAAIAFAASRGWLPLSPVPYLFVLGWASLRLRGLTWSDVGFSLPFDLERPLLYGILIGVALELLSLTVTVPLLSRLTGQSPDLSEFRPMVGNFKFLLLLLGPMWLLAAFGEELVYRGFLLNRVAGLFPARRWAWAVGLASVGVVFAWAHAHQQLTGVLQEVLTGLILGLVYLASGRNLTVPIVAHGVANTLAFLLIYFGRYPGLAP